MGVDAQRKAHIAVLQKLLDERRVYTLPQQDGARMVEACEVNWCERRTRL